MSKTKVLIAGSNSPILAMDLQNQLEMFDCKVNVIGELNNLMVSVSLDKPDVVFIHFHEFTHNAIDLSRQINERFSIPTIFMVNLDSFKDVVESIEDQNILGCLDIPINSKQLTYLLQQV